MWFRLYPKMICHMLYVISALSQTFHPSANFILSITAFGQNPKSTFHCLQVWKPVLVRLCAHYLLSVRRRRLAFDPVANFHLRNGASVWRLNWGADLSHTGLKSSFGIMVNYRYILKDVHKNNQAYLMDGVVPASQDMHHMVAGWSLQCYTEGISIDKICWLSNLAMHSELQSLRVISKRSRTLEYNSGSA